MSRLAILLLVLVSAASHAFQTINVDTYFPSVVQGHRGNSSASCSVLGYPLLTQFNQSKITGTGGAALAFCASNQGVGMPNDGCDNADGSRRLCTVSGSTIPGLSMTGSNAFLSSNGSAGGIDYCNDGQSIALGSATQYQFSSLSLYGTCSVSFSSVRSEYRIQSLSMGSGAKLVLPAGDYWIDTLILNKDAVIEAQGAVRLFVNAITQFNSATLGSTSVGSLLLVGYNDIALNGSTTLTGYVYTDKNLVLNNTSIINGRTTSRTLTMASNSVIRDLLLTPPLTCFSDNFSSGSLADNWVVAQRNNSSLPSVQNGRLRLTQNVINQATSATYQRLFPGASNLVTIEFDQYAYRTSGTNGADGMAVVLSDANQTPQPGAFGGPLGYGFKTGISGFAGGWLGVGLDEYGNYTSEGGTYNLGSRPQAVSIRGSGSGTSGYRYLAGTSSNLIPTVDSGTNSNRPHRYRITVDSRTSSTSMVSVERDTGAGYATLISPLNMLGQTGQAAVPDNFLLSLTGSTGSVTNFHEIDNVQICALRSSPVGAQIDHFELYHSGQPLTCNPETVTIRACANADCSILVTDPVTATLSLSPTTGSNGWVGGNTVTFSGGTTTAQLRNNTAGAVTIGVSGSTPSTKPFSTTLCKAGNGALSTAACTLTFADSGFVFDVPDTYANQPQSLTIKAVKKSDTSQQCVPGFANVSKSVGFWSSYITPGSNPFASKVSVNGTQVGTSQAGATALTLTFDAKGEASLQVSYPDAGLMQLDARYAGSGSEAGLVMTGSDQFVSRPLGLCITPEATCSAGDASCPVFRKTGEGFSLGIKGVAWEPNSGADLCSGNLTTPNFALANIALGSQLVAPKPGVEAVVGAASYDHRSAAGSLNTLTQSVNEIGVFRMTATPPANGYFGYTIPSALSAPVGRFIPWDFNLVSGDITPACGEFSYMGQPFGVQLEIMARNRAGGQTQNYKDAFAKGSAYLTTANNRDGHSLSTRLRSLPSLSWENGLARLDDVSEFVRLSDTQPDGPYRSLLFGLYMHDHDGDHTLIADPDFNEALQGACSGGQCNARLIDAVPMKAYFGRILAGKNNGVASASLPVTLEMERFEQGEWRLNEEDMCTQLSLDNRGFDPIPTVAPVDPDRNIVFNGATSSYEVQGKLPPEMTQSYRSVLTLSGQNGPDNVAKAEKGKIVLHFSAPNAAVRIPFRIDLSKQVGQPSAPLWLKDPDSLQGEAIFGSARGNDRIIYRREVLN